MFKNPEVRRSLSLRFFSKHTESQRQKFLFELMQFVEFSQNTGSYLVTRHKS